MYKALYPYTLAIIGISDPKNPKNNPSTTNGNFIFAFDAPTNLIISISFLLENIVNFIVLLTKNIVTNTNATTIPIKNFSITFNIDNNCSTIPSPYCTNSTLSIFSSSCAVFPMLYTII